jgi:four helix bundle protein
MARPTHTRLRAYADAVRFAEAVHSLLAELPRGQADLANQLQRAATSIVLNIAEGAGEYSRKEKTRFYRIARRSANECSATLDLCAAFRVANAQSLATARELVDGIGAMLTGLILRHPAGEE